VGYQIGDGVAAAHVEQQVEVAKLELAIDQQHPGICGLLQGNRQVGGHGGAAYPAARAVDGEGAHGLDRLRLWGGLLLSAGAARFQVAHPAQGAEQGHLGERRGDEGASPGQGDLLGEHRLAVRHDGHDGDVGKLQRQLVDQVQGSLPAHQVIDQQQVWLRNVHLAREFFQGTEHVGQLEFRRRGQGVDDLLSGGT